MGKLYTHWCDSQYEAPNETKNKFVIGELIKNLYKNLEIYLIHDINKDLTVMFDDVQQTALARNYVVKKFYNILDNADKLQNTAQDANSVYAVYDVDFEYRREKWLEARGLCFQIYAQLDHVSTITIKGTNLQKYIDLSNDCKYIAEKIKNVMIADDQKKKKYGKKYLIN